MFAKLRGGDVKKRKKISIIGTTTPLFFLAAKKWVKTHKKWGKSFSNFESLIYRSLSFIPHVKLDICHRSTLKYIQACNATVWWSFFFPAGCRLLITDLTWSWIRWIRCFRWWKHKPEHPNYIKLATLQFYGSIPENALHLQVGKKAEKNKDSIAARSAEPSGIQNRNCWLGGKPFMKARSHHPAVGTQTRTHFSLMLDGAAPTSAKISNAKEENHKGKNKK